MSADESLTEVIASLPAPEKAPGLRDAFAGLAGMRVPRVDDQCVVFAPAEGAGVVYSYLSVERLCDATTALSEATWAPLFDNPRYEADEVTFERFPDGDWQGALRDWADKIHDPARAETGIAALRATFMGTPFDQVSNWLSEQVPLLFEAYPDGSLWFVRTDEFFGRRMLLLRMLVASRLAPDVFDENEAGRPAHVISLGDQSLTRGAGIGHLIDPLLLVFSPATLGFTLPWMPHSLVFLTGHTSSMLRNYPASPEALYDPGLQSSFASPGSRYADFIVDVPKADIEALLPWWVERLNIAYSHLLDPTRFADQWAWHQPELQLAWLLTFERMVADLLLIQMGFAQPELSRQQAAFDLLDKAETLCGFGRQNSGGGFERMLRRSTMVPRLDEVWATLPLEVQHRFREQAERLYDQMYADVRQHAYPHRLTEGSIKVWSQKHERLIGVEMEGYVSRLIRAVRNSAHGFIYVLTDDRARWDRSILAAHDGHLPAEVPDLIALLGFALVADFARVGDGTWLPRI